MFTRALNWIKNNKLVSVLILLLMFMVFKKSYVPLSFSTRNDSYSGTSEMAFDSLGGPVGTAVSLSRSKNYIAPTQEQAAPRPDISDRKIITNANISLQVKNVNEAVEDIKDKVVSLKGYMVDTSINEYSDIVSGYITVRVPSESLDESFEYFRGLAVKVVSENISGTDITDQYVDIQGRIERLENTKAKFESFMEKAETIEEILNVQRNILNLQTEIDAYKGQQMYMDGASSTTLISVNLSTDELGVPYLPEHVWRPDVVFKQAYRSLLMNLISFGKIAIWLAVYTPLIIVAILGYKIIKRQVDKRSKPKA